MTDELKNLEKAVEQNCETVLKVKDEIAKVIVGQEQLVSGLILGLLGDGHVLVEGVPGLAKSLAVKTLADTISADFNRIQFTPDLLPADLVGTQIYNIKTGDFTVKKGPLFTNIVLADEINRAPAKVQSALLESMQERQISIAEQTHKLPNLFFVMATQNPIEQEGTYPLPEAQVDRFMLKIIISYPNKEEENKIIDRMTSGEKITVNKVITPEEVLNLRKIAFKIFIDNKVKNYITDIVFATRVLGKDTLDIKDLVKYGASPRASIYLTIAGKVKAFLDGRAYVTPQDIKHVAHEVLRHRIILTYEAEAEELTTDYIINKVLDSVEVP
ncbi:MAG TPA: AAA family ATPase [Firmicutes bacterium]|nr:AAA family ATPase [Bacillota bacterium]